MKGFERVMCKRWVGDWTKLQHIEPQLFWLKQHFFLILRGSSTGGLEGPARCWIWFSLKQLTPNYSWLTPRRTGFDAHLLQWALHLHPTQPVNSQGYNLISSTGCTYYLHRCISYLTAQPGRGTICYTPMCRRGRYSFPRIDILYPWSVLYNRWALTRLNIKFPTNYSLANHIYE